MNPRYPIYIPSKGRWESRQTVKALDKLGVPYSVVVESQELGQYAEVIDPARLLVLPFSNMGLIAARNWILRHAISTGAKRHWQLDDNLKAFFRFNRNLKTPVSDGTIFCCMEDFVDRYTNVVIAGPNYFMFAARKSKVAPYTPNTRVYSCSLVRNDIPFRWRSKYNDDTDICLCVLKAGLCTVLFNAFLAEKTVTMKLKGGNTPIYQGDGRLEMAKALVRLHPDVARITWKWGRYQHHVDYRPFKKNRLIRKPGVAIPEGVDNYGMALQQKIDGQWVTTDGPDVPRETAVT